MEDIVLYIQQNADMAPFMIFGLLLLAGLNIPVSEDVMLFISAMLAVQRPDLFWPLFAGVFAGAFFSDLIAYSLGRFLGPKLWNIRWFAKMVSPESVDKMAGFYDRFGVLTLILGRFIPFGVRNALFLTAGLSKMNFIRFALSDLLAATISCSFYFWLYHTYGETVIEYVKKGNMVIFGIAITVVVVIVIRKRQAKKALATSTDAAGED